MRENVIDELAAATLSRETRPSTRIPLWFLLALASVALMIGMSKTNFVGSTDVVEYRCYGVAFLGGMPALGRAHLNGCNALIGSIPAIPFHVLPREYGPLALVIFVLPALATGMLYPWLFALEMLLAVWGIALALARWGAPGAGHAWMMYAMMGSMVTALGRFDVAPALCVVLALVALRRGRQNWAYAALALGVLLKFYPLLLLPLFLIETWRTRRKHSPWQGPALFAGATLAGEGLAAAINPSAVLEPFFFMSNRCVQVESLPSTLSYALARLTGNQVSFAYAYRAMCQTSVGVEGFAAAAPLLAAASMAVVAVLFARGRIALLPAVALTLCLAVLGTRVFSPQYLLWISPLVALAWGLKARAFLAWGAVCLLTTLCYPLSYGSLLLPLLRLTPEQVVPLTAGARNLLLLTLVVVGLWHVWRGTTALSHLVEETTHDTNR
jgi:hypothetical protein